MEEKQLRSTIPKLLKNIMYEKLDQKTWSQNQLILQKKGKKGKSWEICFPIDKK